MRVAVFFCVIVIAGMFTCGYEIEDVEEKVEELEDEIEAMEMEEMQDDVKNHEAEEVEDRTDHDCKTIKEYTEENLKKEKWWKKGRQFIGKEIFKKYNHAYGLMIVGGETFKKESMLRACYLMRYIFADNQHMRRKAFENNFFVVGYNGGWCCPPQMGNQGLSCSCAEKVVNGKGESKKNNFPSLGRGAPAHEMAHYFIKSILMPLVNAGEMKLPGFINNANWNYTKPVNEKQRAGKETKKCAKAEKLSRTFGPLWAFLWNSQKQDLSAEPKGTKIRDCNTHHYFIYTGQEKWLFKNDVSRSDAREKLWNRNPNLYNVMNMVWPCNNTYVSVCEDGSYKFTKGLAQTFLIGKADREDASKMICTPGIDKAEIKETEVEALETPAEDLSGNDKCMKVVENVNGKLYDDLKSGAEVKKDAFQEYLKTGTESAWYLRRCCSKTAKFSSAVKN